MTEQTFLDQMGREIWLPHFPPQRIISLVPSQTELLHALKLDTEVVGITKFCFHPNEWYHAKQRIGGTKTVNFEKIKALQPDLIIGNKEENEQTQIETLQKLYPVWMSDISTRQDAMEMIRQIGLLTDREHASEALIRNINQSFDELAQSHQQAQKVRAAYIIWRKPYMVAASGTFIDSMMQEAGFENVFADLNRYPEISLNDLALRQPKTILLSSEPYPFAEKHVESFRAICPNAIVQLVDGEMFSWYGSRMLEVPQYFQQLYSAIPFDLK